MKFYKMILLVLLACSYSQILDAKMIFNEIKDPEKTTESGFASKKGSVFTIAPSLLYEAAEIQELGLGGSMQYGFGLSESATLYIKFSKSWIKDGYNFRTYYFSDALIKGQYFLNKHEKYSPFLSIAAGLSNVSEEAFSFSTYGFVVEASTGYEIRNGEKFFMSPELIINYRRILDEDLITPTFTYNFGWYY